MVLLYGRSRKGKRLKGFAPHGHWRTLTFLGALRHDRLTAPCVFDGPIKIRDQTSSTEHRHTQIGTVHVQRRYATADADTI